MSLFALVYYSQAAHPFEQEELRILAKRASDCNQDFNITGFLQYRNRRFFQFVEGNRVAVSSLMKNIERDPRHRILRTIHFPNLTTRHFGAWHMRLVDHNEFVHYDLVDLLETVLTRMSDDIYSPEALQLTILPLVNKISRFLP